MGSLKALRYFALVAFLIQAFPAHATVIDNDLTAGTLGYWSVDVTTGGESRTAFITANRLVTADVSTQEIIYDYFSYVDVGNDGGGFQLSGSAPAVDPGDSDRVSSSGTFTGANGNDIQWTVVSSIADNSPTMTNVLTFTATTGTLGVLRFLQYMDEDIQGVSDDVFFTRGSLASNDLELFTVDNAEVYGVSHSGAFSSAAGLANATFAGWAADHFNNMKPRITGAGQSVAPAGVITNLPATTHPIVGSAFGPADIVSVLAWDVDPEATTATIVTTLGGVPDVSNVQCGNGSPEEGEECDDGNVVTTDGCTNDCTICGNEVTTAPEECDDGNIVDGDGCSAACELEAATGVCGDENLDPGEECDDGNLENFDGCSATCTIEPGCGNGRLENDEQCDDGNTVSGDGCSASCSLEAICGDGNVDTGEQCDDGNTVNGDGCSATCTIEPFCGDGNVDTGEQCDDGNTVNGDGCSATCTIEPFCGDGNVDTGEECDDGNTVNGDGCSATCTIEPFCGDGNVDTGEECDDGNTVNGDGCSATCTVEEITDRCALACALPGAIHGTSGRDVMVGTKADETFCGEGGNDYIIGGGGADTLCGGPGNDLLRGGQQADYLDGGEDNDRLNGMGGPDIVRGGVGNDVVRGGEGADVLEGGEDDDRLFGVGGDDLLDGGPGNDRLNGGLGGDTCVNGERTTRCE